MKIGIFDSGIGGTTVFNAIKELLPKEDYLYLADSKNCPYGEKDDAELRKIATNNVETLKNWGAKIVVIACNTATVRCISYLRGKYKDITFVGTEPAVKLATSISKKNILILATPGTIKSEELQKLLEENQKSGQSVTLLPCPGLADTIERSTHLGQDYRPLPRSQAEKSTILKKLSELFKNTDRNQDVIVLGCTHYSLIKPEIQSFFKNSITIDGNSGVAHRAAAIVKSLNN